MQINLFQWLRMGVRQSVLQGVADAIDDLGSPQDNDEYAAQIRKVAEQAIPSKAVGGAATPRRRLGKSLKEMGKAESTTSKARS